MSNKVPCGGFYLDDMLNVDENGKLGVNGGEPYKQLVTDGNGNVKWEDRLAYEETVWKDFTLNAETEITGFTMPPVGDTVTVKVNGVESVEIVKSAEFEGNPYSYIGSVDMMGLITGTEGWFIGGTSEIVGSANPETTVSVMVLGPHKIDEKYLDTAFVRTLSYYTGPYSLYKPFYNESGDKVIAYKCSKIINPSTNTVFIYDGADIGIGKIGGGNPSSFFAYIYIIVDNLSINSVEHIYGTDENDMTRLAASRGYTLTTKPTT